MSKIDQIQLGQTQTVGQPQKSPAQKGPSFQEVLDKAAGSAEETSKTQSPPLEPSASLQTVKSSEVKGLSPLQNKGMEHAERIAELLEKMDVCIQTQSLKQAEPLVKALQEEAGGLETVLGKLEPDPDNAAYGIMEEAWGKAMAESIKFNRGDFIPPAVDET